MKLYKTDFLFLGWPKSFSQDLTTMSKSTLWVNAYFPPRLYQMKLASTWLNFGRLTPKGPRKSVCFLEKYVAKF